MKGKSVSLKDTKVEATNSARRFGQLSEKLMIRISQRRQQLCADKRRLFRNRIDLGERLTLGSRNYERVVRCPVKHLPSTPLNSEDTSYFRYSYFDSMRDTLPDNQQEQLCHPSGFPLALPTIVITDYSTENRP